MMHTNILLIPDHPEIQRVGVLARSRYRFDRLFVQSEGDLLISAAEEYRRAADSPNYRVYEVAGTPHQPLNPPFNPLDWSPVARAAFVAGHS